jgi:hypothetical protein
MSQRNPCTTHINKNVNNKTESKWSKSSLGTLNIEPFQSKNSKDIDGAFYTCIPNKVIIGTFWVYQLENTLRYISKTLLYSMFSNKKW